MFDAWKSDPAVRPEDLATAVMNDDPLRNIWTWTLRIEVPETWRISTRTTRLPVPEGDVWYRLSLFSVHHLLVVSLLCGTDLARQYFDELNPSSFFGPELPHSQFVPGPKSVPGPDVQTVKNAFDAWVLQELDRHLSRRISAAGPFERPILEAWLESPIRGR
ncbi:hypothetical protein [Streptomyces sp. NPDC057854]|uniref:hypothetical protein n=1 Tax=Streptomyces sp. NPDC057854 TaxID=3346264 RepID=UPI0036885AB2